MTNAMALPGGTFPRNCSRASSPPAEAPMPTMGKETFAGRAVAALRAGLADFFLPRSGLDFVLMNLFATLAPARVVIEWIDSRVATDVEFMREPIDRFYGFFHHPLRAGDFFRQHSGAPFRRLFQRQKPDVYSQQGLGDSIMQLVADHFSLRFLRRQKLMGQMPQLFLE